MTEHVKVIRFNNYEEIASTPGFVEDHPFEKESYHSVVGVYRLKDKLGCCFSNKGRVCKTPHNFGYVIRLSDGFVTLVGNECVNKLSGDEKLVVDVKAFKKEESRQDKLKFVKERVAGEVCTINEVRDAYKRIKDIEVFVEGFFSRLPKYAERVLKHNAKSSSGSVAVTLIYHKPYIDDEGVERVEKDRVRTKVYNIKGMRLLNDRLLASTKRKVVDAKGFCMAYEDIKQSTPMRRLMDISKGLASFRRVVQQVEEFEKYYAEFLSNDFKYFCFLSPIPEEREEVAALAISMDSRLSDYKPSELYRKLKQEVLSASGADKLTI